MNLLYNRKSFLDKLLSLNRMISIALLLLLISTITTIASSTVQQKGKHITGVVKDEAGAALPGVSVIYTNSTIGAITDLDGKYMLLESDIYKSLSFSYVGMNTLEESINGRSAIDVVLHKDLIGISEVMVVGYGTQQKKTVTGAVSSVQSEELNAIVASDAATKLQGRVSGVTVLSDKSPGGEASVRVRGYGTINNNDPLFILDGVPVRGGLSSINSDDIESMTVLKDASSAAIYGARAANGVIIITTKRGKAGVPKVTVNARYGQQIAGAGWDLLNTEEYGDLYWLEYKNSGLQQGDEGWGNAQYGYGAQPVIPDYIIPSGKMASEVNEDDYSYPPDVYNGITKANKEGTDWYDEVIQTASIQEYNIGLSGGTNKSNYALSLGYLSQEGIVIYTKFDRYSMRSNSDLQVKDWLKIGQSLGVTFTEKKGAFGDANDEGNVISNTYRMQPIIPVYDIQGNFAGTKAATTGNGKNSVAEAWRNKDDFDRKIRVLANAYAAIDILPELKLKTLVGIDYSNNNTKDFTYNNPEFAEAVASNELTESNEYNIQWNWQNTLSYNTLFADVHKLSLLVGTEAIESQTKDFNANRTSFFSNDVNYRYLDAGEGTQTNGGSGSEWSTFSIFGRANYDYRGKYLAEVSFRRDGSSRFGSNNRYGIFPAFSVGWRVSDEDFMSKSESWLDDFKVRFGWGTSGNDQIGDYNGFYTYKTSPSFANYDLNGGNTSSNAGFAHDALGNSDAKWETTITSNLGIDMVMLNNSLEINLDLYVRDTNDMLYESSIPSAWGDYDIPASNVGNMRNKGFDLGITYHGESKSDFSYTLTANVSLYRNKVTKLSGNDGDVIWGPELRGRFYSRTEAGDPIGSFYGYQVDGIFNTQAEADSYYENLAFSGYNQEGNFKYADIDNDQKITESDRTVIGNPHPDFTYGLNGNFEYKDFDLSLFFQGSVGNDVVNYVARWIDFKQFSGNRSKKRLYESWTQERYESGAKISMPKAITSDADSQEPSSYFVEDASYLRLKNLQLGYNVPKSTLQKIDLERAKIFIQATNLFTISNYGGLDPEIRSNGDSELGVDGGTYPISKTFMLGVNLSL